MPGIVLAGVLAIVLPLGLSVHVALSRSGRVLSIARRNLTRGLFSTTYEVGSLEARRTGWGAVLRALTPDPAARRVRRLLDLAGRPEGWTMTRLLWAKLALGAAAVLVAAVAFTENPGLLVGVLCVAGVAVAYHVPEILLHGRGQERQAAIALELPDVLDQMTIAVEAGLGFEGALARAAATGTGPLAGELVRTLQDVTVGRPRREAYEALVKRTQVEDLRRFVSAINQADAYGIAVVDVLRVQADEMRLKRRQRAEEQAAKVPVKVTFPLIACILPALLVIVVGPMIAGLGEVM
ncbi:type II secretion system F family protein [Geodermatophilus nigrescens]|uniref:type II secretion system F family protein n=1 Tax=Geodermatophilus sp. FMUSA9-8 TaxID=3120155 RepID=UPI00300BF44E